MIIIIWPYKQMVYAQPRIYPGKWHTQTPLGFWSTNGSPNPSQTTRPYNNQQKKITYKIVEFAVLADHRVKLKETEKKDKYLDLANHQRTNKGTGVLEYKRMSGDHPNYCIIEISQNTVKSSGDLRRHAVTQTPVKDHQLMLMWKTLKE